MSGGRGIGGHQRPKGATDEWITPPDVVRDLGPFDLDPCAARAMPWPTAARHLTAEQDGLSARWSGRVWLNPPYGPSTGRWLSKLASHGDGIALVFARTETAAFHEHVWGMADAAFFFRGRIHFFDVAGRRGKWTGGAPSVLIAYGAGNAQRLRSYSGRPGFFVQLPLSPPRGDLFG